MCLNLIQDEISAKFTWLAAKLGLGEKEESESVASPESSVDFSDPLEIKKADVKDQNCSHI